MMCIDRVSNGEVYEVRDGPNFSAREARLVSKEMQEFLYDFHMKGRIIQQYLAEVYAQAELRNPREITVPNGLLPKPKPALKPTARARKGATVPPTSKFPSTEELATVELTAYDDKFAGMKKAKAEADGEG